MRQVELYLTRKAKAIWPTAIILKEELPAKDDLGPRVHFVLEREGEEPIDLGGPFGVARQSLYALRDAAHGTADR